MKQLIIIIAVLCLISQQSYSQIKFSTLAYAYDAKGQKIGVRIIEADISHGKGTMRIEDLKMQAFVRDSVRNATYGMTGYSLGLVSSSGKRVDAAVTRHNNGAYTVVVDFADGKVRYDIEKPQAPPVSLEAFAKTQSSRVTYDDDFTPTLHLSFKNVSEKVITSVEVIVNYNKGLDPYDWGYPTCTRVIQTRISPGQLGIIQVTTPKEIRGNKPGSYFINRIRYEDGSTCDR